MIIKHFQGYGTVNAKKTSTERIDEDKLAEIGIFGYDAADILKIEVSGDHECGLMRDDIYDCYNWLVKRFDKTATQKDILAMKCRYVKYEPETVEYSFLIKKD